MNCFLTVGRCLFLPLITMYPNNLFIHLYWSNWTPMTERTSFSLLPSKRIINCLFWFIKSQWLQRDVPPPSFHVYGAAAGSWNGTKSFRRALRVSCRLWFTHRGPHSRVLQPSFISNVGSAYLHIENRVYIFCILNIVFDIDSTAPAVCGRAQRRALLAVIPAQAPRVDCSAAPVALRRPRIFYVH